MIGNKGGRPKKLIKMDQQLALMCTIIERKIIEHKAKLAGLCTSEYCRQLALNSQFDRKIKVLPKEVLLFTATLNHLAANINQIAKKRNQNDDLNAIERAELNVLSSDIKALAEAIKTYLK